MIPGRSLFQEQQVGSLGEPMAIRGLRPFWATPKTCTFATTAAAVEVVLQLAERWLTKPPAMRKAAAWIGLSASLWLTFILGSLIGSAQQSESYGEARSFTEQSSLLGSTLREALGSISDYSSLSGAFQMDNIFGLRWQGHDQSIAEQSSHGLSWRVWPSLTDF